MRLLNVSSLKFAEFRDVDRPQYIAISHRWFDGEETTFQDVRDGSNMHTRGFEKVRECATYIRENITSVSWLWIDTCCINKDSAAELSEAINSMFDWYRNARLCLAYLADVNASDDLESFENSEWFKRGWTLQELLAPRTVIFVTKAWHIIGYKGEPACGDSLSFSGSDLAIKIAQSTGLPEQVLRNYGTSKHLTAQVKLQWMDGRETRRPEDMSYALYGIIGVTLGANYGEKYDGARQRLLAAIRQQEELAAGQAEYYRKIADWLSSPDPWANHESARQLHEPRTGNWLLEHDLFQKWKAGRSRVLWICGKAGCGKTILCSTAIEDIRQYCSQNTNTGHAVFYFSFSESRKQTYRNLLYSLVVQLGVKEPGLSMLRQAYEKPEQRLPGTDDVETILLSSITAYDRVYLHLDALDECPEGGRVRENVLIGINELMKRASNLLMIVTSRDEPDIRQLVETLKSGEISIAAQTVHTDIQKYISTQLSRHQRLSRLDADTTALIEKTLSQKADGMFKWVDCQLQELRKSKSTRPRAIRAALSALPRSLDETYQRMLNNISEDDRSTALTLFRWIAYAQSPLSLEELREASVIDPHRGAAYTGLVDIQDRGDWSDALAILADFIIVDEVGRRENFDFPDFDTADNEEKKREESRAYQRENKHWKVRFAHFSIQEYLQSTRILESDARFFHLDPAKDSQFLTRSCLSYLTYYSDSSHKTSTKEDLAAFPLLSYTAMWWGNHASAQEWTDGKWEVTFLTSEVKKRDWLRVCTPDMFYTPPFTSSEDMIGSALYYASVLGLEIVIEALLNAGADPNAKGGRNGNALQAASYGGSDKAVSMLIEQGVNVDALGGHYGTALCAAAIRGHVKVLQILIDAGADIDIVTAGTFYGSALQAASSLGHESVVKILVDAGADVNIQGGGYGSALQMATARDNEKIVQMLIDGGADVDDQTGYCGNALQTAAASNSRRVVKILINAGADINAPGNYIDPSEDFGNALYTASLKGHTEVVQTLLDAGADVHHQGGRYGYAINAAVIGGHAQIVQQLLKSGSDFASRDLLGRRLVHLAAALGSRYGLDLALANGQHVNETDNEKWTPLHWAAYFGEAEVVQFLLQSDAISDCQDSQGRTPIHTAVVSGHDEVANLLASQGSSQEVRLPGQQLNARCDCCDHVSPITFQIVSA